MPCKNCRKRHNKCDGNNPNPCSRCRQKRIVCEYDGLVVKEHKSKNDSLSFDSHQQWPISNAQIGNLQWFDETQDIRSKAGHFSPQMSHSPMSTSDSTISSPQTTTTISSPPTISSSSTPVPSASYSHFHNPQLDSFNARKFPSQNNHAAGSIESLLNHEPIRPHQEPVQPHHEPVQPHHGYPHYPSPSHEEHRSIATSSGYTHALPTHVNHHQTFPSHAQYPMAGDQETGDESDKEGPLPDLKAGLLQHYVDNVALFFDMCDDKEHFGKVLPIRSRVHKPLRNAIFALSVTHKRALSPKDNKFDHNQYLSAKFTDRSIKSLNSKSGSGAVSEDDIASIVLLRLAEEMDISSQNYDPQGYLALRTDVIVDNLGRYAHANPLDPLSSLQQAIFYSHLRQEFWISFMTGNAFNPRTLPPKSFEDTDDFTWANRSIAHVADVTRHVYSTSSLQLQQYDELKGDNKKWRSSKPDHFDPYATTKNGGFSDIYRNGEAENFPRYWFYDKKAHVIGRQYNVFAHFLLQLKRANSHPSLPRARNEKHDEKIRGDVRELCGIALSYPETFPAKLVACFAIRQVPLWFQHAARGEQTALLDMLENTQKVHGFPTAADADRIKSQWGWTKRRQ